MLFWRRPAGIPWPFTKAMQGAFGRIGLRLRCCSSFMQAGGTGQATNRPAVLVAFEVEVSQKKADAFYVP